MCGVWAIEFAVEITPLPECTFFLNKLLDTYPCCDSVDCYLGVGNPDDLVSNIISQLHETHSSCVVHIDMDFLRMKISRVKTLTLALPRLILFE